MRGLIVTLMFALFLSAQVFSFDYIDSTIGEKLVYKGTFIENNEKKNFSQVTEIMDPAIVEGATFQVVHSSSLKGDDFIDQKVLLYNVTEEGIFLTAMAERLGGEIIVLKDPSMEYPLPLEKGKKWHRIRIEGSNLVEMDFEVLEVNQTIKVLDREENVTYIKGTGTTEKNGKKSKTEKEIWVSKTGKIRQITKNESPEGKISISEIQLEKIMAATTDDKSVTPAADTAPKQIESVDPSKKTGEVAK